MSKKNCGTCIKNDRKHSAEDCLECRKANEKMNKGLEALNKIAIRVGRLKLDLNGEMYNSLEDMYEPYKTIEKELKALEIIKKKCVDVVGLVRRDFDDVEDYNYYVQEWQKLTQEEFDLLKEVFSNEQV